MKLPIVLIGPMGVGKTTIGKKLAKALELPFIDTDAVITTNYGSPSEIFQTKGEAAFRVIEEQVVAEALTTDSVIATGGGTVLSGNTQRKLRAATVVYLSTDGKRIRSRLIGGNRPLLKNGFDDWKRIYDERKPLYEALASIEIDVSRSSLKETIAEIVHRLQTNE